MTHSCVKTLFCCLASCLCSLAVVAQTATSAQWSYIEQYKDLAVEHMHRYKIPASITLAQGLCESGAGRSRLAKEAHNHFGIKVGGTWTGPYIIISDDRPDDRFRKYKNDAESFEDHSKFLTTGERYRSLFSLKITDYKGWAHGLKRCGYATNPKYAAILIENIERYNLQQFDNYTKGEKHAKAETPVQTEAEVSFFSQHIVYKVNKSYMVIATSTDTWETIAKETGTKPWKLIEYNDLPANYRLRSGDIVYLTKKRTKADKAFKGVPHVVQPGESMYNIAQHYGIRLKNLYKMNHLSADYAPEVGDTLRVR